MWNFDGTFSKLHETARLSPNRKKMNLSLVRSRTPYVLYKPFTANRNLGILTCRKAGNYPGDRVLSRSISDKQRETHFGNPYHSSRFHNGQTSLEDSAHHFCPEY